MKEVFLGIWIPLSLVVVLSWATFKDELSTVFCGAYFLCSLAVFLVVVL